MTLFKPGLIIPTGPVKPPPSGSGLPDRFDRKPVEFKSKFKIACVNGSDRFTGVLTKKSDGVKVVPRFDRLPYVVGLNGPSHFFPFLFWFNFKCPKSMLNERIFEKI